MSGHSPAPWQRAGTSVFPVDANTRVAYTSIKDAHGLVIARVWVPGFLAYQAIDKGGLPATALANIALIEAAPQMLALLKRAVAGVVTTPHDSDCRCEVCDTKALIAAIEGDAT